MQRLGWMAVLATLAFPALAGDDLSPPRLLPPAREGGQGDLTSVTWLETPAHAPVDLVRDGKAVAVVYVADPKGRAEFIRDRYDRQGRNISSSAPLTRLVHELVEVLALGTGATLKLVDQPPAAEQPAIVIGTCEESRKAGIDTASLPPEGFVVKTAPNRVYLVGSTQRVPDGGAGDGTAWAVADFLERFAGVRWYWPAEFGGRSIPRLPTLVIPPAHYRDQPVFRHREDQRDVMIGQQSPLTRSYHLLGGVPKMPLPFAPGVIPFQAGMNPGGDSPSKYYSMISVGAQQMALWRIGSSLDYQAGIIQGSWGGAVARDEKDPRRSDVVLALNEDGTRNAKWNCYSAPETLEAHIDRLRRNWDTKERSDSTHNIIVPNSCTIYFPRVRCYCAACKATFAKGGQELIMGQFLQRLCAEVKQRWPGKKVVFYVRECDTPSGVKFPDNLIVTLDVGCSLGLMGQPDIRREWDEKLRGWGAKFLLTGGSYMPSDWTYGPVQYPHVVRDFYWRNREVLDGGFMHSYNENIRVTGAPTWYVWKRALWNPELDVDATLDEMCRRLFGAGADAARELLRLECERWEKTALSRTLSEKTANPPQSPGGRIPDDLFREIWPAEVVSKMKSLRDQALVEIEKASDADARQAFLYWTWTLDAFFKQAQEIHLKSEPLATLKLDLGNGVDLKLVRIPAGEFLMGSAADELWRREHEGPRHRVQITKPFYMGIYEVTKAQWEAVTGKKPAVFNPPGAMPYPEAFKGTNRPADVTWGEADEFCRKVSGKTGKTVRLPTEAEWEYACRAGSTTPWACGDYVGAVINYATYDTDGYGAIATNAGPQDVGQKKPNVWGLYDMHGNASELVLDWYSETYYKESPANDPTGPTNGMYRVRRGGSWSGHLALTRSGCRLVSPSPSLEGGFAWGAVGEGFRIVVETTDGNR